MTAHIFLQAISRSLKIINFRKFSVKVQNIMNQLRLILKQLEKLSNWVLKISSKVFLYNFEHWKFSLLKLVDNKIEKYSDKIRSKSIKSVFNDPDAKIELKRLKEHFVIVPIDKAANNISFICKQHYASVIVSELKYNPGNTNNNDDTYELVNDSSSGIVNRH